MISQPAGAAIYLVTTPCDMRKGMNGLAGLVQSALKANPHSGALYVFRGKRGDLVKILGWDGSGLCLFIKRLEENRFVWPPIVAGRLKLTPGQLSLLLEGIDWRRTVAPAPVEAPEMI